MGMMMAGQQAAIGRFLAFSRTQESSRRLGRRQLSRRGRDQRQRQLAFFQRLQNLEYPARDHAAGQATPAPTRCPASASPALSTSIRRIRPGTGRPIRRSRSASSGSGPS